MARVEPAEIEGNSFQKIMGHCPEIVEKWYDLDNVMRFSGQLDPKLKEEVRRSLADGIGCQFCASLGEPNPTNRDQRTALAVAFADNVFANFDNLAGISDETFDLLRSEFTDPEIIELVIWTLFMIAGQGFGALMRVDRSTPEELKAYLAWREDGEAKARSLSQPN